MVELSWQTCRCVALDEFACLREEVVGAVTAVTQSSCCLPRCRHQSSKPTWTLALSCSARVPPAHCSGWLRGRPAAAGWTARTAQPPTAPRHLQSSRWAPCRVPGSNKPLCASQKHAWSVALPPLLARHVGANLAAMSCCAGFLGSPGAGRHQLLCPGPLTTEQWACCIAAILWGAVRVMAFVLSDIAVYALCSGNLGSPAPARLRAGSRDHAGRSWRHGGVIYCLHIRLAAWQAGMCTHNLSCCFLGM
jgi:hypothetical protein